MKVHHPKGFILAWRWPSLLKRQRTDARSIAHQIDYLALADQKLMHKSCADDGDIESSQYDADSPALEMLERESADRATLSGLSETLPGPSGIARLAVGADTKQCLIVGAAMYSI